MTSSESDFVDDIVSDRRPEHTAPPSNDFKPWHRVRKEFIRQLQWNELTIRLVKRRWRQELRQNDADWNFEDDDDIELEAASPQLSDPQKRPLRCLVVPGDDLLDVRALWRDTESEDCHIHYLGFNESHGSSQVGTRVHIANNAITSLPRVSRNSQVIPDRFEAIIHPQSQARRYLKEYGPYHVVNLDFCGSIFPNTQSNTQVQHNAIHELLIYQFAEQKSPWLLFITTEVQPSIVDYEKLDSFCRLTRENYDKHAEFRQKIDAFLPSSAFANSDSPVMLGELNDAQIISLFGVALGKWLLNLCHSAQPSWSIAMRRSFQYTINEDKGAVMLALAFELSPNITPPLDPSGISNRVTIAKTFPDECQCALRILKEVQSIQDVDSRLDSDSELKIRLTGSQADLLESAGYDKSAFLEWIDSTV